MSTGIYDTLNSAANVGAATTTAAGASKKTAVTHDDFLKLLVMQLTHQDPLKPMEDIDFMGQLAQMQALDEQIAMTQTMRSMRIDTQLQATSALIGKLVSGADENNNEISGVVKRVVVEEDIVYAQLDNGLRLPTGSIRQVWDEADSLRNELAGAQSMIGLLVSSIDDSFVTKQGVAVNAAIDSQGVVWVGLHDGTKVRYNDIYEVSDWLPETGAEETDSAAPETSGPEDAPPEANANDE